MGARFPDTGGHSLTLGKRDAVWIVLAAAAVGVVYAPVVAELFRDWLHDANYSHGFLIPAISGFLIWQRRSDLVRTPLRPSVGGLALLLISAALLVLGVAGAEVFTQRVSLIGTLAGGVWFLAGGRWLRKLAFPILFLLLAVPLPYVIYYDLTGPLQGVAARSAIRGLQLVGIPAVAEGNIIHLQSASLEVAEACSGIRSLYAFLALGALLARTLPLPFWGRIAVFLLTIPLSVVGNAMRVWGSGVAAHLFGARYAQGLAHELFGLVIFAVALGVLALVGRGVNRLWPSAR